MNKVTITLEEFRAITKEIEERLFKPKQIDAINKTMNKNKKEFIFSFGKHKGELISDIPSTYLHYMNGKFDKESLNEAMEAEIERRSNIGK